MQNRQSNNYPGRSSDCTAERWIIMDILKLIEMTLSATMRMGTPLLLASVGGMFASRCGIMPLGVEGMITIGAFSAVCGSYFTASPWIGLLLGVAVSSALALLNAWLCIRFHVNHIIGGLGLNMLVAAVVGIFLQTLWGSSTNSPSVESVKGLDLPFLTDIPIVGALFSGQFLVTYVAILLVPLTWFLLFRTKFGMRVRIIGNNPYVASTSGVQVNRYKYMCMLLCGILAGLAGAFLSICQMNMFVEGMSSERGYISNVICALGSSNPVGILGASFLFGLADAAQLSLQDLNIPSQLLRMLPYCVTVIALMFVKGNRGIAAFEGKHFEEIK